MKSEKAKNIEFGMMVSLILLIISLWMRNDLYRYSIVTLLIAMLVPVLYTPFARLWFHTAKLLEQTTSKIVLLPVFFIIITPVGIIRRLTGKDPLQLKRFNKDKRSVFEEKTHQYTQQDMEKQF
jgi:predicted membrane protein